MRACLRASVTSSGGFEPLLTDLMLEAVDDAQGSFHTNVG